MDNCCSSLIGLPFKLGSLITEEPGFASCVNSTAIELLTNTGCLFSEPKLPLFPVTLEDKIPSFEIPQNGVIIKIESSCNMSKDCDDESCLIVSYAINKEIKGDDPTALVGGPLSSIVDSQLSEPISNDHSDKMMTSNICHGIIKKPESWVSEIVGDLNSVEENGEAVTVREPKRTFSASILEVPQETKMIKQNLPSDFPPRWGSNSICGRRAEMEDSVMALPRFLEIPSRMLSDSALFTSIHKDLTGHFFGVYDGHGGSQVSTYCRERLHLALADEIRVVKENLGVETGECNSKGRWLEVFGKCFRRLDDEVGGFAKGDLNSAYGTPLTPIAPDSVGSTAVVAVVCWTHIVVANCGDSRAVLNRGKEPMPLSVDHRPNSEDECARIEAAGGKVINWDGYRVSGVLAVSRSIGDRYLRPYVISDPEIMIVPRTKEDECLILASDGLWDVIKNEEACHLARKRILLWHKKYGPTLSRGGDHIDPAAQDAADYLSRLAFQRGSRDNISVIVIDLKSHRKFKKKDAKV
ncbi:hypothetical protein OROHE_022069 [Orobanche hederae]